MKKPTKPKPKSNRGGARAGAGRPIGPHGRGAIVPHRVAAALLDQVQSIATTEARAPSDVHNQALAAGLSTWPTPSQLSGNPALNQKLT